MPVRSKTKIISLFIITILSVTALTAATKPLSSSTLTYCSPTDSPTLFTETTQHKLAQTAIAERLGWVESPENNCGGYYLEEAFIYPVSVDKANSVEVTSKYGLLSQRATSILQGEVTITRYGQQITANKAFLYRNPTTGKLSVIDMIGNVHLREPNTLILGKQGRYNFETKSKAFINIVYRTSLQNGREIVGPEAVPAQEMAKERKITGLTAWGRAHEFSQTEPKVYELYDASYTTCPPINPTWHVQGSHIVLNKNTGRGYATHARLYIQSIPVFYTPYINFPIDRRRKTGFLWPTLGGSNKWGPYLLTPFYWNMAPNYDMVITPGLLSKRGVQLTDNFGYLTPINTGKIDVSVLPNDKAFADFQKKNKENPPTPPGQDLNVTQAELNRLLNSNNTRKAFFWRDDAQFNNHWSSHVDFNYAGDDYYLRDFGSNLNEITQNQLLQEADVYYKSENWNFTGRMQAYQTLHPIDEPLVLNQYRRFPQLILNGDYPDQAFGLDYFVNNEVTHFDIRNTPGTPANLPIGNRMHLQPGVSLPLSWPYLYFIPRMQLAMTQYQLYQTADTDTPNTLRRVVPIFDIASGLELTRDMTLFNTAYQQTLEPQIYYTYIPYRNQSSIPIFDTTVSTLTYDQLFNYNRFSGIDRIGDANQLGVGVTTRLIDQTSGFEKVRLGVGELFYFSNRHVTLCNSDNNSANPNLSCSDNPNNPNLYRRLSPLSGLFKYNVNPYWNFTANSIWNPITKQLDNTTLALHYQPDAQRIINLGYSYARDGDPLSGVTTTDSSNNLKVTDFSFAWPVIRDVSAVGRWSQNWNHEHLQNLLYGLQYDTCCWAVRFVGGKTFVGFDANNNNQPQYNKEFYIQFSLKGMGNIGSGNPSGLLSSITGYNTQFGQDL